MEKSEYEVLSAWFDFLTSSMHDVDLGVDLIIYLRTNPEKAMERIQSRSRGEEHLIPMSHVEELHQLYEDWLVDAKFPWPAPVVVINADQDLDEMVEEYIKQETLIFNKVKNEEDEDTDYPEEWIVRFIDTD